MRFKLFVFCLLSMTIFQSCLKDKCTSTETYAVYNPVFRSLTDIRTDGIKTVEGFTLKNPGKIYFYNNYLLINEQGQGIHFYDISNPTNPVEKTFYQIEGNFDMAIKDNVLIADNTYDLISIDISDVYNPVIKDRIQNYKNQFVPANNLVVAYYTKSKETRVLDCSDANFGRSFFISENLLFSADKSSNDVVSGIGTNIGGIGVGGSFSRFTLYDDYLYTVSDASLHAFKIDKDQLEHKNTNQLGWGIETIFPYKDKLFIGSSNGMFIFDNSTPESPRLLSSFDHANACDPVVVKGDVAYVTLRNGNTCNGFTNQLDVIDISVLTKPSLIKSYKMDNPHGLAVTDDNILYICEGEFGLKTLNASDASNIKELAYDKSLKTYDVIALGDKRLLMIGGDGFYQYDASNPDKLKLLSVIPVQK